MQTSGMAAWQHSPTPFIVVAVDLINPNLHEKSENCVDVRRRLMEMAGLREREIARGRERERERERERKRERERRRTLVLTAGSS
jgi:hypothetical protein